MQLLESEKTHNMRGQVKSSSGKVGISLERSFDLFFGVILLLASAPLILCFVVFSKIVSPGPVIFKQMRIGRDGRPFLMYKFRTMHLNADVKQHEEHASRLIRSNQPMVKMETLVDNRLIPMGRFLRASGLDELPQVINVFRGEMSVIGPRPCLPCEFEAYSENQTLRFRVLPGITGLWQVSGKNRLTFSQMIGLDERYVRSRSLWMNLTILVMTPLTLLKQIRDTLDPRVNKCTDLQSPSPISGVEKKMAG